MRLNIVIFYIEQIKNNLSYFVSVFGNTAVGGAEMFN